MRDARQLIFLAAFLALGGCEPVVTSGGAGGAPAGTTASTSSTASAATSTTTSTTSGAGGACPSSCASDAECQTSCPATPNAVTCCDTLSAVCYVVSGSTCLDPPPPPKVCAPGGACKPGDTCLGSSNDCGVSCACDATGHYQCETGLPPPACPAETPSCDAPCDDTLGSTCHCQGLDGDARACSCQGPPFKWYCAPAGDPCPPGVGDGISCAQFADGQICAQGFCGCHPACGTQVWSCLDI